MIISFFSLWNWLTLFIRMNRIGMLMTRTTIRSSDISIVMPRINLEYLPIFVYNIGTWTRKLMFPIQYFLLDNHSDAQCQKKQRIESDLSANIFIKFRFSFLFFLQWHFNQRIYVRKKEEKKILNQANQMLIHWLRYWMWQAKANLTSRCDSIFFR